MVNQKYYIGLHSTNNLNDGYMGSGKKLREDIKIFGIENFSREIICHCETREEAFRKEAELVNSEFLKNENVYNLICGGIGCIYPKDKSAIYSHSKKIRKIEYKEERFERYDESCFYNIIHSPEGLKEEIFEKEKLTALNKISEFLTSEWHNRGYYICYYITKLINNKYTHDKGVKFLNQLLRFPVMKSEIRLCRSEWGQLEITQKYTQWT